MTSFVASVSSVVHLALRAVLATFSVCTLVLSARLIAARFNVVELLENDLIWIVEKLSFQGLTVVESLTTSSSSSSSSEGDQVLWYAFLYGELTLSVLVPLGVHGLLTSTRQCDYVSSSVSTYMMLAIVLGLFLAHRCMDGVIKTEQQKYSTEDDNLMTPFEKMVGRNKLLVMAILSFILSYILILGDKAAALSSEGTNTSSTTLNRTTPPNKKDDGVTVYYTYQFIRTLVKSGGVFNVAMACMVLYMATYSSGPADLIPQLKLQAYDLESTFGKDIVYSNEFYYVIQCTMLSTILQTLFVGLATTFSHIAGETTTEALNCGLAGVPLIIGANVITIAIYGDDFKAGTDCMIAHISILASANCYIPFVWWIHRVWKSSNYNPYLRMETQPALDRTDDHDKEKIS